MYRILWICISFIAAPMTLAAQCIVINEVMINGPGSNDGQNSPNTEEWIELYNTCTSPIDIGCYVLTDGDYGVTIPSGTILQPGAYFTIGSINAGFDVDLDVANCGCAGGTNVGVLTNGDEQMLLFDDTYNLADGVIWGAGQMPVNFYQVAYAGCVGQNFNLTTDDALEVLPTGGGQGCVLHRACDGSMDWEEDCTGGTPGASNGGTPNYSIVFPSTALCVGDCFDWQIDDPNGIASIAWTMEGALNTSSNALTASACYDQAGVFAIEAQITSSCGVQNISVNSAIEIESLEVTIEASDLQSPCPGESPVLSASTSGTYQWFLDNQPLFGANSPTYAPTSSGDYLVQVTSGSCVALSNALSILYIAEPTVAISASPSGILCPDSTTLLTATTEGTSIAWYMGTTWMGSGTTLEVTEAGNYYYTCAIDGCFFSSPTLEVTYEVPIDPILSADTTAPCPGENALLNVAPAGNVVEWLRDEMLFETTAANSLAVNQSGSYAAQVVTSNGCTYLSNTVVVEYVQVTPPTIALTSGTTTLCPGQTATLSAQGTFDGVMWYQGATALASGSTWIASEQGNYSVLATAQGCTLSSEEITITLLQSPTLEPAPSGNLVACDESYSLPFSTTSELVWTWNGSSYSPPNIGVLELAGDYTVTAVNTAGCASPMYSFNLAFIESPPVVIVANDSTPCAGSLVQLTATGSYQSWIWGSGATAAQIEVSTSGVYEVMGYASNGCQNNAYFELQYSPYPTIEVASEISSDCVNGALLHAISDGALTWQDEQGQVIGEGDSLLVDPSSNALYAVSSALGECISESWTLVVVDCDVIYIPNAFTPDNDGINDVFKVELTSWGTYHLEIFDRWGTKVFESNDPNDVWTGGVTTHYVCDGVYHYRLEALNNNGEPIGGQSIYQGHITVVR